jgi:DNA modification methylase
MKNQQYTDFLASKIVVAEKKGISIDPSILHPSGKPHQNDIIVWSLAMGAALIAADTGMGKSHMGIETMRVLVEKFGGKALIVTELGAAETFINQDPEVGEGARLSISMEYVTCQQEAIDSACGIVVTNYERVRNGEFDFAQFTAVWLDEGNYIKNMASETTDMLQQQLKKVNYKYIATATPSPNETLELVNYAHVLGICDRGQILTRFFQRNSVKAGDLTLHPQHEDDFWMWVSSWGVFIQRPSDLGYPDEGYSLPELNVYWHEVKITEKMEGKVNRDGQKEMFISGSASLPDAAKIKRLSIKDRLHAAFNKVLEIDGEDQNWIIWHHLEDERKALNNLFKHHKSYADVFGSLHWQEKERRIVAFSKGELQILATKPEISGVGCNFQKHCNNNILLGVNHSFDEFYQLIKRTHRYGQTKPVNVHVFYCPEEYDIVNNLKQKWEDHDITRAKMRDLVLKYGLNQGQFVEERKRSMKVDRKEYRGKNYLLVNTDCVPEIASMPDNSVDMILTSIPFGNHYEYTDKYNDFGHNTSNAEFFKQMDFLVPELLRVLKPGRIAAFHTKNRIHYGSVTGLGFSIFHRFTHAACDCFERNGFHCMGFHYVPTDVVAENNQTYRLGYTEACKDMTKMGAGIPEEIWIFRKSPTSNADAYADEPVKHNKEDYHIAGWQIDADGHWRSSGNRYLNLEELTGLNMKQLRKWWNKFNQESIYDFEQHLNLLKSLDEQNKLSRTFTTLPLRSVTPFVWNDVNRMHGLNMEQSRRKQQNHICPMPFDQVDRLIELYSNPGDTILDPFGGLCTTGVRAVQKNRKAILCELNDVYAKSGAVYLKEAEQKNEIPTLFDLTQIETKKSA